MYNKRMKRTYAFLICICICLLSGCGGKTEPAQEVSVTAAPATSTPAPVQATPTPVPVLKEESVSLQLTTPVPEATATPAPTPTATPTPTPVPEGLIGYRYKVFAEGEEQLTEELYKSQNISITVRHASDNENFDNYIEYHVADIYVQDVTVLRAGCAGDSFNSRIVDTVDTMAEKYGAVLAVSGDYYAENPGVIVRNGIVYSDSSESVTKRDCCVLYKDGSVKTFRRKEYTVADILAGDPWHTFNFGPALLDENGKAVEDLYLGKNANGINPRCIFGYYEPGHYALVVIDGRDLHGSRGLDLEDLSRFAQRMGFRAAYNLDGGNSAVMCWRGEIYNNPSYGGRSISDILYIAPEGQDLNAEPADITLLAGKE